MSIGLPTYETVQTYVRQAKKLDHDTIGLPSETIDAFAKELSLAGGGFISATYPPKKRHAGPVWLPEGRVQDVTDARFHGFFEGVGIVEI